MGLMIYKKQLDYSYTFGAYPTIELLEKYPEKAITVLLSAESDKYEGIKKIKDLCQRKRINYDYSTKTISKLAKKENTQVIGVFKKI